MFIFLLAGGLEMKAFGEPTVSSVGKVSTVKSLDQAKPNGWQMRRFFITLRGEVGWGLGKILELKTSPQIYFAWSSEPEE